MSFVKLKHEFSATQQWNWKELTIIRFHVIWWTGDFSFTILPLRLKPLCCLRNALSSTAYVVRTCVINRVSRKTEVQLASKRTTLNFCNSLILDSRDAPCHTATERFSVYAWISFFHCIIATVGLREVRALYWVTKSWRPTRRLNLACLHQRQEGPGSG